jgi:hypothetical protein
MTPMPVNDNDINHLLNPITGAGITIQLLGYGAAVSCLLKLYNLPFIELYIPRNPGDASYKEVKVKRSNKDEVLAQCLAQELIETKGDSLAFADVLIDLYKNSNRTIKNDLNTAKKLRENEETDPEQPPLTTSPNTG